MILTHAASKVFGEMSNRILSTIGRYSRAALGEPLRRAQLSVLLLLLLVLAGTLGYMALEHMGAVEALYMTVITISTVGFGEVHPLSNAGRLFTIGLIVLGALALASTVGNTVEVLLGQRLWTSLQRWRMEEWLMKATNHYVVCGYGRIGQQIVRDLRARDVPFVVIEADPSQEETFLAEQITYIIGNATLDETQLEAGTDRARGFVAALDTDADNVLAVLTARGLNPDLFIVARATSPASENKLRRAGANRVVSPYDIGGHRISLALLRPAVHDLLNQIFDVSQMDTDIGEIHVTAGSRLAGQTIGACDLRRVRNLSVLAIQGPDSAFTINPGPRHTIQVGETLIVIGPPDAIYQLEVDHETKPD
jgi:voltage-gated potassium channel